MKLIFKNNNINVNEVITSLVINLGDLKFYTKSQTDLLLSEKTDLTTFTGHTANTSLDLQNISAQTSTNSTNITSNSNQITTNRNLVTGYTASTSLDLQHISGNTDQNSTDISNKIDKVTGATNNQVPVFSNGSIIDSGIHLSGVTGSSGGGVETGNIGIEHHIFFDSDIDTTADIYFTGEIENLVVTKFSEIDTYSFEARLDGSSGFTSITGSTNSAQVTNLQTWITTNTTASTLFIVRATVVYESGQKGEGVIVFKYDRSTS